VSDEQDNSGDFKQLANDRLVHALLSHVHDARAGEHREERVRRVLAAIRTATDEEKPLPHPSLKAKQLSRWVARSGVAAAAMLLISLGIWVLTSNFKTAHASLNDILGALRKPGDRTYRIRVEPRDPQIQPMLHLDGATLYLRDGVQYLLERPDPAGGLQYDGYDGRQSWRINSGRVVETREGLGAGGVGVSAAMSDSLYENPQSTLSRIGTDYTVDRFEQAAMSPDGTILSHVVARHGPGKGGVQGPPVIEIWADPKTRMPRQIVFQQDPVPRVPESRRMVFLMVNEASLPADWFTTGAHTGDVRRGRGQ
jgi:hypothetical protein